MPLTAINARFIIPLRILRAGSPAGKRAVEYPVPRARRHCSVKFRSYRTMEERFAAQLFEWSLGGLFLVARMNAMAR